MPRVQTIINEQEPEIATVQIARAVQMVRLRPGQLGISKANELSRPGPVTGNETQRLAALSDSLRTVGLIEPLVVDGSYNVIDGKRRRDAAALIDTDDTPFLLDCVIRDGAFTASERQVAIHANLHRAALTPLQFATLCKELRAENNWRGTKELAEYVGVSRAQISQHDKLLVKPEAMPDATYRALLTELNSGRMGADTAFFALTKVDPHKAPEVMQRAAEIEQGKKDKKAAAKKPTKKATNKTTKKDAPTKATKPTKTTPARTVTTASVRQAAQEHNALNTPVAKTLADYERLASRLQSS